MGPGGGKPGRPTQAVGHTCSGNIGIVKILCHIRSDKYTASATKVLYEYIAHIFDRKMAYGRGPALKHT
jgi:hypothetical protein